MGSAEELHILSQKSAESCKPTDWWKGRLPWDVNVVSLSVIGHSSDFTNMNDAVPWLRSSQGQLEAAVTHWHMGTSARQSQHVVWSWLVPSQSQGHTWC